MLVYRYENEDGYGPFTGGHLAWDFTDAMLEAGRYADCDDPGDPDCWHNRFPNLWEEGLNAPDDWEDRCAVRSPRDVVRWFPKPCREVLAREGFRLAAYEVPDDAVLTGDHQVVFDASRAVTARLEDRRQLQLQLAA